MLKPFRLIVIPLFPTNSAAKVGSLPDVQFMLAVRVTLLVTTRPQAGFAAARLGNTNAPPPSTSMNSPTRQSSFLNALRICPSFVVDPRTPQQYAPWSAPPNRNNTETIPQPDGVRPAT